MGFDTSYQYDGGDAADSGVDTSTSDALSPGAQSAMSEGLDDYDAATAPPAADTPPEPTAPAPAAPDDQGGDWQNIQPHIGGKIEADTNKEAEGRPVWLTKGETEAPSPEPPEGWHPGGPEGGC